MTYFTKEELIGILNSLIEDNYYFSPTHMHPLLLKIQAMIDKYCERDKSNLHEINTQPNILPNTKCYKCKSEFYVHPLCSMNARFILDCDLHRSEQFK